MKRFIELLDYRMQPIPSREGVIKCDNRLTIADNFKAVTLLKMDKRARFMQMLIGVSPLTAKSALNPVAL